MRFSSFIIAFFCLLFSCKKIKEKKYTGTYVGVLEWTKSEHELVDGIPSETATYSSGDVDFSAEIERSENFIYLNNNTEHVVYLDEIGLRGDVNYSSYGGGGKYFNYSIIDGELKFSAGISTYDGPYPYFISNNFTGMKTDD